MLEDVFSKLLKEGLNPNQYWDLKKHYPANYSLETHKFRAFRKLIEYKETSVSNYGPKNSLSILGFAME
jgi:hypothetical protein